MLGVIVSCLALLSFSWAQQINFPVGTGIRSLFIPYKTVSGVPFASILGRDASNNHTTYVLSCPTAQPACALAPNLTLTEGTDVAKWHSHTSGSAVGNVEISCGLADSPVTCSQVAHGGGNIQKTSAILAASDIIYQAVNVTATSTDKKTLPHTVTVTAKPTTTSTTSTSTAGVQTMTGVPWAVGGAVGAGLLALAAL